MSLNKSDLKQSLLNVFNGVMNGDVDLKIPSESNIRFIQSSLAKILANAYHEWALDAMAGGMKYENGNALSIFDKLISNEFSVGWGVGVSSYWSKTMWKNEGISVGVLIPVSLLNITADLKQIINISSTLWRISSIDDFADKLSNILYINTVMTPVTQTILATGVTSTVFIS